MTTYQIHLPPEFNETLATIRANPTEANMAAWADYSNRLAKAFVANSAKQGAPLANPDIAAHAIQAAAVDYLLRNGAA